MTKKEKPLPYNTFLRYSTMGFQMLGVILVFTWLGVKADEYLEIEKPLMTAVFSLFGVCGAMYKLVKDYLGKLNN